MYLFTTTTFEDLTPSEQEKWEEFVSSNEENFWSVYQTSIWTKFFRQVLPKRSISLYLMKSKEEEILCGAIGYKYPLFGRYSWLYFPRGPIVRDGAMYVLHEFITHYKRHLSHIVWIRFDPALQAQEYKSAFSSYKIAHKAYHPDKTLIIDLEKTQELLLKEMHQKGRYNIKVAIKNAVQISGWVVREDMSMEELSFFDKCTFRPDPIEEFAAMIKETGDRDGFSVHDGAFYRKMLHALGKEAFILLAHQDGKCIGGGIFVLTPTSCIYYYGASRHKYRTLMAPYLVQWKAIQYAQSLQKKHYDFLGIGEDDEEDPLYGVTQFKMKFGGKVRTYVGTYEVVLHKWLYRSIVMIKKIKALLKR